MDLDLTLQETAFDQGHPFATHLGCEVFASSNIFYSILGTVQILIVLQGVHGMTRVCSVWIDVLAWQCGPRSDATR